MSQETVHTESSARRITTKATMNAPQPEFVDDVTEALQTHEPVREPKIEVASLHQAVDWFEVLQTTTASQTAVMTLDPGNASSDEPDRHPDSEQILLVVDGEVEAEIAATRRTLRQGDIVIVPKDTPHRFVNTTSQKALTFTVYAPPAYPE